MSKKIFPVLNLLILINVLNVCWSSLVLSVFVFVIPLLQDEDRCNYDASPQRIFVKAFGDDKRELIKECLREHRENQPLGGRLIYVNSQSMCAFWLISVVLSVTSCAFVYLSKGCSRCGCPEVLDGLENSGIEAQNGKN